MTYISWSQINTYTKSKLYTLSLYHTIYSSKLQTSAPQNIANKFVSSSLSFSGPLQEYFLNHKYQIHSITSLW